MVEDVWVASVTHGKDEPCEVVDDTGETVEITRDAASGERVADEELVHRDTHYLERINAAQLDTRTGEIELFLVACTREQRERAQVVERRDGFRRWDL
jgi:hypothetical protein